MGLMECLPDHSRIVYTPHPISCEGQRNYAAPLVKGETLGSFLRREVPDWTGDAWEVRINGVLVPVEVMERVRPKNGTLIEVRGVAKKQALYIVAMITLTYFTMGAGATWAGALGASGMAATAVYAAAYVAGSVLINKVLGPKPASAGGQEQTVYNIGASPNQARPYQPLPLVFGRVKFAPDIISAPYTWYEGDDQYLGMVLTPGPNMMYLISRSITQGPAAGIVSLGGVALGFVFYMLCAAFGITALLFAIPYAYDALRFAGAAYLLWLAWQAVRPGGRSPFQVKAMKVDGPRKLFAMGFLTNLLNPKIAMLYLALLPQFIDPAGGSVLTQSLALGSIQIVISVSVNAMIALAAGSIAVFLGTRPTWLLVQRWLMGTVLAGLAMKMALEARRA